MSLIKLFVSGLLVAGGLILGAFTLQGYLDPDWALKQAEAARIKAAERARQSASIAAPKEPSQFVTVTRVEQPVPKAPAAAPAKARAKPDAATADANGAARQAPRKKEAERVAPADRAKKSSPAPQPQQASFDWPWLKQLLGSN
jgi:hypothetical protein